MMLCDATTLVLPRLVQRGTLCYAVIVAFPNNVGIWRKRKESFDGLSDDRMISIALCR